MFADGAHFRGFGADMDVTAIAAFPTVFADAYPDFTGFQIGKKFAVAFFMAFFDFSYFCKLDGKFEETFIFGFFGEVFIHFGPFFMFTGSGGKKICFGISDPAQSFEPEFCVFFFVVGSLFKDCCDLFIPPL